MLNFRTYLLVCFVLCLNSCKDDPFTLGSEWFVPNFRTILLDTITPQLSTVQNDSLITMNRSAIFVGQYNDTWADNASAESYTAGKIYAESYMELSVPATTSFDDQAEFDSIVFEMKLKPQYFGDTTKMFTVNVHRLKQEMTSEDGQYYWNTTKLAYYSEPLAAPLTFYPEPTTTLDHMGNTVSNLRTKIDHQFGADLFRLLKSENDTIKKDDLFVDYFQGLALIPGTNNKAVLSMVADTSFKIRLYYHVPSDYVKVQSIDFPIKVAKQYYYMKADRAETGLDFNNEILVPSTKTKNLAFVQSAIGLHTRIDFPSINSLNAISRFGAIEQALLIVRPVQNSYGLLHDPSPLPKALTLYAINELGAGAEIQNSNNAVQTGSLYLDYQYPENTRYTYDITAFLKSQIGINALEKSYLRLSIPQADAYNTLQRVVFGNSEHTNKIELQIYYTIYDDQNW